MVKYLYYFIDYFHIDTRGKTSLVDNKETQNDMPIPDENNGNEHKKQIRNIALKDILILFSIIIIVIIVLFLSLKYDKGENPLGNTVAFSQSKSIRINEYMTSNTISFMDEEWESSDWIEIYNYGTQAVWLGDVYISDSLSDPDKFLLPDVYIQAGEYVLVLASGKTIENAEYIHASFKLGADDNELILFSNNEIINKLEISPLPTDISAGYSQDNTFGYFAEPTPGSANTTTLYNKSEIESINTVAGNLIINEYLSNNEYGITDASGNAADWIEIYNPNDTAVNLGEYYLSDDEYRLNKYNLPNEEIEAKAYVLVYASGEEYATQNEYSAPFAISEYDDMIILSYKTGQIVDYITVDNLPSDVSAGKNADGELGYFSSPTPGYENGTESSDSIDIDAVYSVTSPLVINEWMPNNEFNILDAFGSASDWIEIYNPSNETISLDGYSLTDDMTNPKKWLFPSDAVIEANSYILVFMSGQDTIIDNQMHSSFKLGSTETLCLNSPNSGIIDSVVMEPLPGNVSKGRTEDGYGYFALPTPNGANITDSRNTINNSSTFIHSSVYISEVASSTITAARSYGKYTYEYIEIYNPSNETIDLNGYSIVQSDGAAFIFGDVKIKPAAYIVVSVKGYIDRDLGYIKGENLSLNSAGERLILKNSIGIIIDCFDTGYLLGNLSSGRTKEDDSTRVFFTVKTPGAENTSPSYSSYSTKPSFNFAGGMVENELYLEITADGSDTIYYTLDGSIPTEENAEIYSTPILVSGDSVVRAVSATNGKLTSLCMTSTYIAERTHDIPIVCLASDPDGFFSTASGIYADGYGHADPYPYWGSNYHWNVERLVSFEYYLTDNTKAVAFDGGIQIAGAYSRALPQKSLCIRLRDEYGLSEVDYPFFELGTSTFQHLLLRNSGQDHFMTKMRDAYILNCATDLGTVDCKRATPVAVYINGEYWGLYNLRDKLNADYFTLKYGYDDDVQINFLTHYSSPKSGDADDWWELEEFCISHDFNIRENYDALGEWVDINAFIDYFIVQITFNNRDTHNISFWKAEIEGGKWRPILYDMDLALLPNEVDLVALHLSGANLGYHDFVKDALVSSEFFREEFLNRFSYVLNNIYTEEYLSDEINEYKALIDEEIMYHIERWPYPISYERWEEHIEAMRSEVLKSRGEIPGELQDYFDLTDEEIIELFPWYTN